MTILLHLPGRLVEKQPCAPRMAGVSGRAVYRAPAAQKSKPMMSRTAMNRKEKVLV